MDHYAILGNVLYVIISLNINLPTTKADKASLYIGLAVPTFCFWTLPLLHGRKPYILGALSLVLPLQLPQAVVVGTPRSPYEVVYRVALLLARAASGFILGFVNVNSKATLLELFGSSLQSSKPHEEVVWKHDPRRRGGGMGLWLGIWSWCFAGSLGVGFLIGAVIVSELNPAWGFWLVVVLGAVILVLNILVPEVRRSPFRRSMTEVRSGTDISRRLARGEIRMHLDATGPLWWGEEVHAGFRLCWKMVRQPGFTVLAVYMGWLYGQIVMVIVVSPNEILKLMFEFS